MRADSIKSSALAWMEALGSAVVHGQPITAGVMRVQPTDPNARRSPR